MEPLDYLRIVRRRWPVIVVVAILGAAIGFATAPKRHLASAAPRAKSYTATYVLALDPTSASATAGGGVTSSTPNLASMAFLTTAGQVPQMAAKSLGYSGSPAALAAEVSATPNATVNTLLITATDPSATRATEVADAFATSLIAYLTKGAQDAQKATSQRLQTALNDLEARIGTLDSKIAGASRSPSSGEPPVDVLQAQRQGYVNQYGALFAQYINTTSAGPATSPLVTFQKASPVPTGPVASAKNKVPTSRAARAAIGGLVGLLVAIAAVVAADLLDPRIRTRQAAERAFRIPVLAELPFVGEVRRGLPIVVRDPSSIAADAYRKLRAALLFGARPVVPAAVPVRSIDVTGRDQVPGPAPLRREAVPGWDGSLAVLLVTAADPGQGTSTVVANLAASFGEAGRSVLVISADFRTPAVHRYLGAGAAPGLTDALANPAGPGIGPVIHTTRVPGVRLVPSGTPYENEIELLTRARAAVAQARGLADVVIVDTPPITAVSDAAELIPAVDGVLFVCRTPGAHVSSAKQAIELAEGIGAPLLGVALVTASTRGMARRARRGRPTHRTTHPSANGNSAPAAIGTDTSDAALPASNGNGTPPRMAADPGGFADQEAAMEDEDDTATAWDVREGPDLEDQMGGPASPDAEVRRWWPRRSRQ